MKDKKIPLIAILLVLSIGNFTRIKGTENIRAIEFLSIFVIGAFSGILLTLLIAKFKNKS
ncbi:MAG: hypothetical protein ABI426_11780 [Flavobacterium sp.]